MLNRTRVLIASAAALVIIGGGTGAAMAATSWDHKPPPRDEKAHCLIVSTTGSQQYVIRDDHGKGDDKHGDRNRVTETYTVSAKFLVCEGKDGKLAVKPYGAPAASETEPARK